MARNSLRATTPREAIIKDLGGNPASAGTSDASVEASAASAHPIFPQETFDSIKAYRNAEDPDAVATIQALADIAALLDVLATQVEGWNLPVSDQLEELGHSLLELLASNYVRLRWPRLFMLLQAVSLLEELGSTYGEGSNGAYQLLGNVVSALFGNPSTSPAPRSRTS